MNQRYPGNLPDHPVKGMFTLRVNNCRKRGRMQPIKTVKCEGTLYSSRHINLDTQELPIYDFASLSQMISYLQQWGEYEIEWGDNDVLF